MSITEAEPDPCTGADARPLRADADRNRRAILAAADRVFAERGFDVPLAEIAVEAGVGRATLYRNFSTRTELAFALFERNMREFREFAAALKGDPGDLEALVDLKLALYIRNGGLVEAMQHERRAPDFAQERAEVARILHDAARPGMAAGLLRPDLTVESFAILDHALGGVMLCGGTIHDRRTRGAELKRLLFDGLRVREGGR
ncbi:MAG: TetR/AcrR family transcriptional regulator [Rubellimicrobium sp.]|nr:TetR/AcrR family transcriptional regulator [Rubellimicrobium sp.]